MSAGVAFVTGASSGLGRGLSRALARDGWKVGLAARRRPLLERLAEEIRGEGGSAGVFPCDVRSGPEVHQALAECGRRLGPVELLVANAGVSVMTEVERFDAARVEDVMRVNFLGAVYAVEAALPGMLARGHGHLVAVGSLTGYGGLPRTAAYSASKAALHRFFESLRVDLRGTGVAVTVITPGYVDTPLTSRNLHRMPFLLSEAEAVRRMMRAIRRRDRLAAFPFPLAALVRVAQILPSGIYDALASRVKREKRRDPDHG